jgi:hypothetical protein
MSGGMQAENGFEISSGYQYYCGHPSFNRLVPSDLMAAMLSCIALRRSALPVLYFASVNIPTLPPVSPQFTFIGNSHAAHDLVHDVVCMFASQARGNSGHRSRKNNAESWEDIGHRSIQTGQKPDDYHNHDFVQDY